MEIDRNSRFLSEEISFKEILINLGKLNRYLLSKWKFIILIMIVGALSGYWWAKTRKLKYVAVSTFLLQDAGGVQGHENSFSSFLGINNPAQGNLFQGENLIQLYQTRFMIKKALLSEVPDSNGKRLIDYYLKVTNLKPVWALNPTLRNIDLIKQYDRKERTKQRIQDSLMTEIINDIRFNYLNVSMAGRLSIMRVEVRSTDEEFAKILNDQIVSTVNDFYIQTKTKKSLENVKLLKHQTDSVARALNGSMYNSAVTVQINPNRARETLRLPSQRSQVNSEINRAMLNELSRDLGLAKMALRRETPLIQMMDGPVFPLEKEKISTFKWAMIGGFTLAIVTWVLFALFYIYKKIINSNN